MIRGIGIDIVKIDRINDNNIKKYYLLKREKYITGLKEIGKNKNLQQVGLLQKRLL